MNLKTAFLEKTNDKGFLVDLIIYISLMFLVREIYIPKVGFIANGLFWSLTSLIVASWRMKVRGVSWRDIGLKKPNNFEKKNRYFCTYFGISFSFYDHI